MSDARQPVERDLRLDFFRGVSMLIIFIAHLPDNPWTDWIPARFGFSSAAETFVFCSGYASSLAFGRTFLRHGFGLGCVRILHRCWQVYWAHIAVCLIVMAATAAGTEAFGRDYFAEWGFGWFRENAVAASVALMDLQLMPADLNILPMYLVLLALIPVAMLLSRVHPLLPLACAFALWLVVQVTSLNLHAGQHREEDWFFDPFAWQFLFFTGFSIGMGWLRPPAPGRTGLFRAALAFIILSVPFTFWGITRAVPFFQHVFDVFFWDTRPTTLHILRYAHFLALAYVSLTLIEPYRPRLAGPALRAVVRVGQQTLPSFQTGLVLGCVLGMAFDALGHTAAHAAAVNLVGLAGVIAAARVSAFFKVPPWHRKEREELRPASPSPLQGGVRTAPAE